MEVLEAVSAASGNMAQQQQAVGWQVLDTETPEGAAAVDALALQRRTAARGPRGDASKWRGFSVSLPYLPTGEGRAWLKMVEYGGT